MQKKCIWELTIKKFVRPYLWKISLNFDRTNPFRVSKDISKMKRSMPDKEESSLKLYFYRNVSDSN